MTKQKALLACSLGLLLSACGIGAEDTSSSEPAVGNLESCYTINTGVEYKMTDVVSVTDVLDLTYSDTSQAVARTGVGQFKGEPHFVQTTLVRYVPLDNPPSGVEPNYTIEGLYNSRKDVFWRITPNGIVFPGYTLEGGYKAENTYTPAFVLPLNARPLQTFTEKYSVSRVVTEQDNPNNPQTYGPWMHDGSITFLGVEKLTVGDKTFENACHMSSPDTCRTKLGFVPDSEVVACEVHQWVAKDFGVIKTENRRSSDGSLLPGYHREFVHQTK